MVIASLSGRPISAPSKAVWMLALVCAAAIVMPRPLLAQPTGIATDRIEYYLLKQHDQLLICWDSWDTCTVFRRAGANADQRGGCRRATDKDIVWLTDFLQSGGKPAGTGWAAMATCGDRPYLEGMLCVDVPPFIRQPDLFKRCGHVSEVRDWRLSKQEFLELLRKQQQQLAESTDRSGVGGATLVGQHHPLMEAIEAKEQAK